jgi:hypothetical protein
VDRAGVAERPYDAFIVYGHAHDRDIAAALQQCLGQVAKPWFSMRSLRVFRDETNLAASPSLWTAIASAVDRSKYLVYLASPESAHSAWVRRELEYWVTHRSTDQLLIVRTGGVIAWSTEGQDFDWEQTTALSPALRGHFHSEPFYVDLGWLGGAAKVSSSEPRFRQAVFTLAAAIQGMPRDELVSLDNRHRRSTRRILASTIILLILFLGLAIVAFSLRKPENDGGKTPNSRLEQTGQRPAAQPGRYAT